MDELGELHFLGQLAERPQDPALRAVFGDWLLERGDPRGEVIALGLKGGLSLTERRRVARITQQHQREWLGPLLSLADPHRTRFDGGFLDELVCLPMAFRPPARGDDASAFIRLAGDVRLATCRSLVIPPAEAGTQCQPFLRHRVLRHLQRLELGAADWRSFGGLEAPPLQPSEVVLSSFGVFGHELTGLGSLPVFKAGTLLGLATTEFLNVVVVQSVLQSLLGQARELSRFREVRLIARYGVLEGLAAWLRSAQTVALPALERWSVESGGVLLTRERVGSRFPRLSVDLSLSETQHERRSAARDGELRAKSSMEIRIATAASVLVQLAAERLTEITVDLAPGARLRSHERSALLASARRSGALERFTVGGERLLG